MYRSTVLSGVVLDVANRKTIGKDLRKRSKGWKAAIDAWKAVPQMRYAVMFTPTAARERRGLPLLVMVSGKDDLASAVQLACAHLSDVGCQWLIKADPEAEEIARAELLHDAVPKGTA